MALSTRLTDTGLGVRTELAQIVTRYSYANLLNTADADFTSGKYLNTANGALSSSASYVTSGFIPVSAGDKIRNTRQESNGRFSGTIAYICAYDSNKTFLAASGKASVYYYDVPANAAYIRMSYPLSVTASMVEKDVGYGTSKSFLAYGVTDVYNYPYKYEVDCFVPDEIRVAVGVTLDIYYRAICPQAYAECNFIWTTLAASYSTVTAQNRKLSITGVSAGSRQSLLEIFDGAGNLVFAKWINIRCIVASTATKSICPIGDSLTSSKAWLPEMVKYDNNISFVGNKSWTINDSGSTSRTGKHAGYSGWTPQIFFTLASSSASGSPEINPFWDATLNDGAGGFSWAYYVTNSLASTPPDIVQIMLGMNALANDPTTNAGYIKSIVDAIRADSASMPIIICPPQQRDYSKSASTIMQGYDLMVKIYELFAAYTLLYIVPIGIMHDSEYNYQNGTEIVNPRSAITQPAVSDATHPQAAGYYQFADAIYSEFSYRFTS